MESFWQKNIEIPSFSEAEGEIKTDVLVIGGGMAGILCAYMLKKSGVSCVIAEAGRICSHTTAHTTAKITFQHGLIYDKIIQKYGVQTAKLYLESQKKALEMYRELSNKFDCDFEERDSYVYSVKSREKIEKEVLAYEKLGQNADFFEDISLPFSVKGAVRIKKQAQFNPLKFIYNIARDQNIYENTRILEITSDGAVFEKGKIKADKIIVATHFPFIDKHGFYFLKMYQHRSYVVALENCFSHGMDIVRDMYTEQ